MPLAGKILRIGLDGLEQPLQEVGPAMDIAHSISSYAGRHTRRRG